MERVNGSYSDSHGAEIDTPWWSEQEPGGVWPAAWAPLSCPPSRPGGSDWFGPRFVVQSLSGGNAIKTRIVPSQNRFVARGVSA